MCWYVGMWSYMKKLSCVGTDKLCDCPDHHALIGGVEWVGACVSE